jgi:hypothetical protein
VTNDNADDDIGQRDVADVLRFITAKTTDPEWQVTLAGFALAELCIVHGFKRREAVAALERAIVTVRSWRDKAIGPAN